MDNSAKNGTGAAEGASVGKTSGKKKKIIAAVAVCCAVMLCVLAAVMSETLTVMAAERDALKNDFESAYNKVEDIENDKAATLRSYLELRMSINENYPLMLSEYNPLLISQWLEQTTVIIESNSGLNTEIISAVYAVRGKLAAISGTNDEYVSLRDSILSLMDIFAEYNRLHSKTNGENVSFTVNSETEMLTQWRNQYQALQDFSTRRMREGSNYLLTYLLSEVQSELDNLQEEMDSIIASGYDANTAIRYSDNIQRQYPDITNRDGDTVNLLNKQEYERYMYKGICTGFASQLAEFYIVKG